MAIFDDLKKRLANTGNKLGDLGFNKYFFSPDVTRSTANMAAQAGRMTLNDTRNFWKASLTPVQGLYNNVIRPVGVPVDAGVRKVFNPHQNFQQAIDNARQDLPQASFGTAGLNSMAKSGLIPQRSVRTLKNVMEAGGVIAGGGIPQGVGKIAALDAASALPRLAGYTAIRGAESAALGTGQQLANGERVKNVFTPRNIGTNAAVGAVLNMVGSPRLSSQAAGDVATAGSKAFHTASFMDKLDKQIPTMVDAVAADGSKFKTVFQPKIVEVSNSDARFLAENGHLPKPGEVAPNIYTDKGTSLLYLDDKGNIVSWRTNTPEFANGLQSNLAPQMGNSVKPLKPSQIDEPTSGPSGAALEEYDRTGNINDAIKAYQNEHISNGTMYGGDKRSGERVKRLILQYRQPVKTPVSAQNALEGGLNPKGVQTVVPPVRSMGQKEKSFTVGARTSPDLSIETQNLQKDTSAWYDPRKNSELKATAISQIDAMGMDAAKQQAMNAADITDEGTARAIEIAKRLDASGQSAEANQVLTVNAERALQAGRAGQANALLARQSSLGIRAELARMAQSAGKKIPDEVMNTAGDMMDNALKLPEGREKNLAIQKVNEYVKKQFPSSLLDQGLTIIQAGLLTGFKTSGFNETANLSNAIIKKVSDVPSTAVDAALSLVTGKRTKTFTFKGLGQGAWKGTKEGLDYLISGYDPTKVGSKYEGGTVFSNNKVGKFFQVYTDTVYRFMGSQDRPFNKAAFFNSIADQASAEAKNLGLKGQAHTDYVEKMLLNPTEDIGRRAAQEADVAVFANDTAIGKLGKAVQNIPGGKAIVPFAKTPSAVVTTTFSYTPVGPLYEIGKQLKAGKLDQRALSEAIGKGASGTGLLWLGSELYKKGMITTGYPTEPKNVGLWTAQNKKENSITFPGGVQIPAQAFGPASQLLVVGAAMQEAKDQGKDPATVLPAQIGNLALSSPALQGLQSVTNAAKDPVRYGETWTQSLAGETVPTLSGDVAQWVDRAPNGQGVARQTNSPLQAVTNKIPVLRQNNPVALDNLGQPRTTGKNTFQTMFDPTRSSSMNVSDPVISELQRLQDTHNGAFPTKQDSNLSAFGKKLNLTQDQTNALTSSTGSAIKQRFQDIMSNSDYAKLPDEEKAKILNNAASDLRSTGNKMTVINNGAISPVSTTQSTPAVTGRPTKDQLDMVKFQVDQDQKTRKVGDTYVYYDPESGSAKVKTTGSIALATQIQQIQNDLDSALKTKDYAAWKTAAEKQYNMLDEQTKALDPVLDAAKILANQNQMQDLKLKYLTFAGYGRTTKPKKGKTLKGVSKVTSSRKPKLASSSTPKMSIKTQTLKKTNLTVKNGTVAKRTIKKSVV